jgi:hypothetical protein
MQKERSPLHSLPFSASPTLLPLLFVVVIAVIAVEPVASQTDLLFTGATTTTAPSYSEGIIDFGELSPTPTYAIDFSGAGDDATSPTPSSDNFGLENVGQGMQRTISPTIDTALLTGRGMPSRTPTYEPTLSPTERGFGTGVTIPIPGVDMNTLRPARPPAAAAITAAAEVTRPTTNGSKSTRSIRGCWSSQTMLLFLLFAAMKFL